MSQRLRWSRLCLGEETEPVLCGGFGKMWSWSGSSNHCTEKPRLRPELRAAPRDWIDEWKPAWPNGCDQNVMPRSKLRSFLRLFCIVTAVCCLFGLSVYHSYSLGQYRTMYDNPVYRWRASIAVALSELHDPPLRGYVAYQSISDYLNWHGLALMEGEASPLPSFQSVRELIYNPDRLDKLFKDASAIPIDYSLSPIPIVGNEKGEAAFYYWAFRLFGIHIASFWYFYFLLLATSVLAFLLAFWRSSFCMLLLMLYLVGHLYMVDFASSDHFQTVHNSRFFPVLALLPTLHLVLLAIRRVKISWGAAGLAAWQACLLFFVIFSRLEAGWQPIAVVAASAMSLPFRQLLPQSYHPRTLVRATGKILFAGWPALLVIVTGAGLIFYQHFGLDRTAYAIESKTYTFWDPLLVGTVSANPELNRLYGMGQPPYSDTMGYYIASKYVVEHNDTTSPIAVVKGGIVVSTFAMHNMGAFDAVQREVFFTIVREHPFLVLRAFLYDKPRAELEILLTTATVYRPVILACCVLLALISGLIIWATNRTRLPQERFVRPIWTMVLIAIMSLATTFIFPTADIPDTILVFLWLLLLIPGCAPVLIERWSRVLPSVPIGNRL